MCNAHHPTRLSVALALAVQLASCADQPQPTCAASASAYAARLIEQTRVESAPGACAAFGPAAFRADPELGISTH